MSLQLQNSLSSLEAIRNFNIAMENYQKSQTRISTGKKITSAGDDPSRVGLADTLSMQVSSLKQVIENVNDSKNILQIADDSLSQMISAIQEIKSKASEASNDSLSDSAKTIIKNNVSSLLSQMSLIERNAAYGGKQLLNGLYTDNKINIGANAGNFLEVSLSSAKVSDIISNTIGTISGMNLDCFTESVNTTDHTQTIAATAATPNFDLVFQNTKGAISTITVDASKLKFDGTKSSMTSIIDAINNAEDLGITAYQKTNSQTFTLTAKAVNGSSTAVDSYLYINGTTIKTTISSNMTNAVDVASALVSSINNQTSTTGVTATKEGATITLKTKETGGSIFVNSSEAVTMLTSHNLGSANKKSYLGDIQLVASQNLTLLATNGASTAVATTKQRDKDYGSTAATIAVSDIATKGLDDIDVSTIDNAQLTMVLAENALTALSEQRASVGEKQSTLERIYSHTYTVSNNVSASVANITDIDFAEESLNFANFNTLVQTSAYALSQAKANSQIILTLLK